MLLSLLRLSLSVTFVATCLAQLNSGTGSPGTSIGNSIFSGSKLCNRTFADANSTGIFSFNPDIISGAQTLQPNNGVLTSPFTWAATVFQPPASAPNATTELSLWYSPNGANYSNNFQLGYDACYLWISSLTINTFERGQTDVGDCLATLDSQCVGDLTSLTDNYSAELVGVPSPGPNSNLTTNSLPGVCTQLASMLTANFPRSCEPFFNSTRGVFGGAPALGGALTGNQSIVERSVCRTNSTYSLMWSQFGPADLITWEIANYFISPLITVFMPIADVARPVTLSYTKSIMSCVHPNHVNPGSEAVAPAPSPTPVDTSAYDDPDGSGSGNGTGTGSGTVNESEGLGGGAIAGIVIGVVLGLALVAGLLVFFLCRKRIRALNERRRARRGAAEVPAGPYADGPAPSYKEAMSFPVVEAPVGERHELENWGASPALELPANFDEKPGVRRTPVELEGSPARLHEASELNRF